MATTKLDTCGVILKMVLTILTLWFLLIGLAIIAGGAYLVVLSFHTISIVSSALLIAAICIIVAGFLWSVISVIGLVGALAQLRVLLIIYAVIIVVIIILEIIFGVFVITSYIRLAGLAEGYFNATLHLYGNDTEVTEAIDDLQSTFECCGLETPGDWLTTSYYKTYEDLPLSCCSALTANQTCEVGGSATHFTGCFAKALGEVLSKMNAVGGVAIVVGLVEVIDVVLALWLCCSVQMKRKQQSATKAGPEAHKPCKERCVRCLSRICPCAVSSPPADVPAAGDDI